jgi:hypothetical protein
MKGDGRDRKQLPSLGGEEDIELVVENHEQRQDCEESQTRPMAGQVRQNE